MSAVAAALVFIVSILTWSIEPVVHSTHYNHIRSVGSPHLNTTLRSLSRSLKPYPDQIQKSDYLFCAMTEPYDSKNPLHHSKYQHYAQLAQNGWNEHPTEEPMLGFMQALGLRDAFLALRIRQDSSS